jgi:IS605 OrfB family transposase
VEGKIASIRELNNQQIKSIKERIKIIEKKIVDFQKRKRTQPKIWLQNQRLSRLNKKLRRLEENRASGKITLCFGSRKLFNKQFNGDQSHEEWKQEWEQQRNKEFFALGSKDETAGNQTCKATVADDGSISLRLRLPDSLDQGKYLEFHNLRFAYGHSTILAALEECRLRRELNNRNDPSFKDHGQALSYRFQRDDKGWRVFVSTNLPKPEWTTDRRLGAIGIDINSDHLAVVETDRHGNPIYSETIPYALYGKTQNQRKALIGDACARAVEIALAAKKNLIVEQLDFTKKKNNLKEVQPKSARMLSSFAYSMILRTIRSRAYRLGVELFDVNPAFTSLIGRIKYATRYGLTTHHAAALCIARRHHGFSESFSLQSSVPDGKGGHIAFSVPVRNQEKNEWQYLKNVAKKLRAALAEHFWVARCQSTAPPKKGLCDELSSKFVGEIPTRESLATLLG